MAQKTDGPAKRARQDDVLNAPVLAVLSHLPHKGPHVIVGPDPEKPRHDLNRPWRLISKHARPEGVRLHDLRHTHASVGAGAGIGLSIIGKLLGHARSSTTQRYAHLDADPLRRASEHIAGQIAQAMGEPEFAESEVLSYRDNIFQRRT
jgi:integrase